MPLTQGQLVRVRGISAETRNAGEWCLGRVILVSENGKSAGVQLDGAIAALGGFIAGYVPLVIDEERETVTGLLGEQYEVEVQAS